LVRFQVHDAQVPAGRLRVYDGARRLLGTAGVLGSGDRLYGELWLPLRGETTIVTELELPNRRGVWRGEHRLRTQPRWTLYWVAVADPARLLARLDALLPWQRAIEIALLREAGVGGNPLAVKTPLELLDHVAFLRIGQPARELEERFGIPISPVAVGPEEHLGLRASASSMAGIGVHYAILQKTPAGSLFSALEGRDGSRMLRAAVLPGGDPRDLGFAEDSRRMLHEIERLLTSSPFLLSPSYPRHAALLLTTEIDNDWGQLIRAVQQWNARFAFPRIVTGHADEFFSTVERGGGFRVARPGEPGQTTPFPEPATSRPATSLTSDHLTEATRRRRKAVAQRASEVLAPLNILLGAQVPGVEGFAHQLASAVEGTLVFNPSGVARTDVVTMPDGAERMVTDVPALGYVYLPDVDYGDGPPYLEPGDLAVVGQRFTVRLDQGSGAIASLYSRDDGLEWVRPHGQGINAVEGSRLSRVTRWRLPGIGNRLVAERSLLGATGNGEPHSLRTTITVYDGTPWVDIENVIEGSGGGPLRYGFDCEVEGGSISWETPGGYERQHPPAGPFAHLRWLRLESANGWALHLRAQDAPYAEVDRRGHLVSITPPPPHRSRYRLGEASPYALRDEPWLFGWSAEPFVSARVSGRGPAVLPTYDSVLRPDEVGVAVLGVTPAAAENDAVVYLQELLGFAREVTLRPGLLGFRQARQVDVLERDLGEATRVSDAGDVRAAVSIGANGVAAVRLMDLFLNRA
jgi:hypothetical protein